jgi:arylsulfatase A-like enzyme
MPQPTESKGNAVINRRTKELLVFLRVFVSLWLELSDKYHEDSKTRRRAGGWGVLLWLFLCPAVAAAGSLNLVLILTDNHGSWTLGTYGNRDIRTPNIDRLARAGMLFENVFSSNAVCSPTRATLLTGLLPSQHGVHRYLAAGGLQVGPGARSAIAEFRTLPEILAGAGYVCGLSGKWHLGDNMRPQAGFTFWVTMPHGGTTTFNDAEVIEDGKVRREPTYLTEYWTRRGIEFIETHRDRPFFLFLSYNGPYGLGPSMLEAPRNRHAAYYADKTLASFPREPPHPWLKTTRNLLGNPTAMRRYAAEISAIDDGVGEILAALRRFGLERNTLVVFTADQGLAGGQGGFWGMGDHTEPITAFDWTMRVPLIFHRPGSIAAGRRHKQLVSNYDLFPTIIDYLGLSREMPSSPPAPGHSFAPVLRGAPARDEDAVFYEFENVRAIRTLRWKYIERLRQEPNELYDLRTDPEERRNLTDRPEQGAVKAELRDRLHRYFNRYADPKWDLWRGGRSKTNLATRELFGLENPEASPPAQPDRR